MTIGPLDPTPRYRPRRLELRDGRCVTLRGIVEADAAEIIQAFERLSANTRYMRFMQHKKEVDPAVLHCGVRPVAGREFAFVATVPADDGIDIVGAARYVPASGADGQDGDPDTCEFAITVADDWRGTGLANVLLASLVRRARHDGYRVIEGSVLAENAPMLALARLLQFKVASRAGDATLVRVWRELKPAARAARPATARSTAP